jgi:hypothetical protein
VRDLVGRSSSGDGLTVARRDRATGCRVSKKPEPEWPPPTPGRRGFGRSYDPFYAFEQLARDDGKPYKPPEPKAELQLLAWLGSKGPLVVMYCLLLVVVGVVLALLITRA